MQRFKMVLFMIAVSSVFGSAVTSIHLLSQNIMKENKAFLEQKSLVELFDLGKADELSKAEMNTLIQQQIDATETCIDPETNWEFTIIKAYKDAEKKELKAYGFEFEGLGFWAPIKGKLAVTPDLSKTVGIKITQQQETPGLGGRIEEEVFTTSFTKGLTITPPKSGKTFLYMGAPELQPQQGSPKFGRKFDAITGATQTSMSMERMLNEFVARFVRAMNNRKEAENGI
jgi:Na+-transporting NADH:ubiquinone oxidoreductase subunit C